jgi:hypothetical protein
VEAAVAVLQASGLGADRALAVATAQGYLLALADGAGTVAETADVLASCVRLPSGALQDDVAVVVLTGETN